jgi:hypothetical protein
VATAAPLRAALKTRREKRFRSQLARCSLANDSFLCRHARRNSRPRLPPRLRQRKLRRWELLPPRPATSTADALFCFITFNLQIAKMTPEELERLRNRCKKFGLPFPGASSLLWLPCMRSAANCRRSPPSVSFQFRVQVKRSHPVECVAACPSLQHMVLAVPNHEFQSITFVLT